MEIPPGYGPMGTPHISSQWWFNGLKPKNEKVVPNHSGKWKIIHSHSHPYFTSAAGTLTEISRLQDLEPLRNVIVLDEDLALGCSWPPGMGNLNQYIYIYHIRDISHFWLRLELVQSSYNYLLLSTPSTYSIQLIDPSGNPPAPNSVFQHPASVESSRLLTVITIDIVLLTDHGTFQWIPSWK